MFKKLGRKNKIKSLKDELEHQAQIDELNEVDFDQLEIKKYKPNVEKSSIDYQDILDSVDDFKNRTIYSELTCGILEKTEDSKLLQVVFDNLIVKIGKDFANELRVAGNFNKERQTIYSIWVWISEMDNGGFLQFFNNSSSQFHEMVERSLNLLNANEYLKIIRESKKFQNKNSKHLKKLDDKFYELSSEKLECILIKFIKNNIEHFID